MNDCHWGRLPFAGPFNRLGGCQRPSYDIDSGLRRQEVWMNTLRHECTHRGMHVSFRFCSCFELGSLVLMFLFIWLIAASTFQRWYACALHCIHAHFCFCIGSIDSSLTHCSLVFPSCDHIGSLYRVACSLCDFHACKYYRCTCMHVTTFLFPV